MRALDCVHPAHEDMHATAANDEELVEMVRQHIAAVHPDMSPEQATEIVAQNAYDEPAATGTLRAFDCPDGTHLHGRDDEALLREARRHADEVHADQGFTDEQLRGFIQAGGYADTQHAST